jgi:hypothetical protein
MRPPRWFRRLASRTIRAGCRVLAITLPLMSAAEARAQEPAPRASVVFGLTQPLLLRGFNVEGDWWTEHVVVDYSHGINLHVPGTSLGGEYERQGLDFLVRHSLGIGVGYRITRALNVRLEPKVHVYDVHYATGGAAPIGSFRTYTLGAGVYYLWRPFRNATGAARWLSIVPSLRYWPQVASSLDRDRVIYASHVTGRTEVMRTPAIGAANTPWIVNVSVGWTVLR